MSFSISPGVTVTEVDLTTIIPAVSSSVGGLVGEFRWGPAKEVVLVSSENELVAQFGKPDTANAKDFFTAASFLAYTNALRLVRSIHSDARVAHKTANGIIFYNDTDFETYSIPTGLTDLFCARYAGAKGNSLAVSICPSASAFTAWTYKNLFTSAPGTSAYAEAKGSTNDECHIVVIDLNGAFTGLRGQVLEKYAFVSKLTNAKAEDGSSNYWVNKINSGSSYVHALENSSGSDVPAEYKSSDDTHDFTDQVVITEEFANGADGTAPTDGDLEGCYDLFSNAETVDVSLLMTASHSKTVAAYVISNIAEIRKDCVVFVSPDLESVVNNASPLASVIADREELTISSSYGVMDCNYKLMYDKYNDVNRWVPLNGDVAGCCARTDAARDPWWSPAGLNRGNIKNVIKLAYNPDKAERDDLYQASINPVISITGEGVVLYGDKTLLTKSSAFSRINVRRLFITLEKAISLASRYYLFEFNDSYTRAQFTSAISSYLRKVKAARGVYDYKVVCDETNNTGAIIDANQFVGDIYIKPARSINAIQLNFVAVRSDVAFEEVVGSF